MRVGVLMERLSRVALLIMMTAMILMLIMRVLVSSVVCVVRSRGGLNERKVLPGTGVVSKALCVFM
jgi:hypothetical protein